MAYFKSYRPSKFTIGYADRTGDNGQKIRGGYPTCRWLKEGNWTELGKFSKYTGGYKPHQQRDEEKQLKKDLGMKIEELDNEPLSGFQVVEAHHGYAADDHFVRVRDPRGFCLNLDSRFIEKTVFKWHLGISGNGVLDGKWFYLWKAGRFLGIHPESELANVDVDDAKIEAYGKTLKSYELEDLVVGRVYDIADEKGDKSIVSRAVYLGQKMMPSMPTVRNFFSDDSPLRDLGRHWKNHLVYGLTGEDALSLDFLPWNQADAVKKAESVSKPWKLTPVFILLEDMIQTYSLGSRAWYCDDLAGLPEEDKEHSILFPVDSRCDSSSFLTGRSVVKRLVNEDSCQDLRITAKEIPWSRKATEKFRYTSLNDYKTMKLETLNAGFDQYLVKLKSIIDARLELCPPRAPADLKAWRDKVGKWYREDYEPNNCHKWWW